MLGFGSPPADHGHGSAEIAQRLARSRHGGHLKDAIYGAMDGAVTTFAIVAGVQGAGLSPAIILALGAANLLADGFSMAAGNYSGTKAERDDAARLRAIEERHIDLYPEGEREEIRQILAAKGLDGSVLERAVTAISGNRRAWIELMLVDEYGLSPKIPAPLPAALVTFTAFLMAGLVPLAPFALGFDTAFGLSIGMTAATFFSIGALKSRWSLAPWWRSAAETLLIGGMAALIAYVVGAMFRAV
ncbi:VIT1/CCC1 transporter family protein [Limimaricola hongkongensis]|uniref:Nodulin 21-related protein n=1 Tax=Limimaricola hongkongensis DSM 17492 TaxID=1122180 RepID=A0A017HES9_9RHOB|nr:VIT1/CCC1 transporter family protein [Limimaricola hongkongensis]EYD72820.1 nodulin 21-related protein [Limimaricola hongkongensis DSM 17492]